MTGYLNPCGSAKENTLEEIWNNDFMKDLRQSMMHGKPSPTCNRCYKLEESGLDSPRLSYTKRFSHLVEDAIESTFPDGTSANFELKYWDFRVSNLCNFKCRMCGHGLSSHWYSDHIALNSVDVKTVALPRVIHFDDNSKVPIRSYIDEFIDSVEEVYFAGGEPLLMDEHYFILDELLRRGRTDVRLLYSTNLSKLEYKTKRVADYLVQFKSVTFLASLDAVGPVGEYIRSGSDWEKIEANVKEIIAINPEIVGINATVQIFNVLHIPELLDRLLSLGMTLPKILIDNVLDSPAHFSIRVLPDELKALVVTELEDHLKRLTPTQAEYFRSHYDGIINFMNGTVPDRADLERRLKKETIKLDLLRGENYQTVLHPSIVKWMDSI